MDIKDRSPYVPNFVQKYTRNPRLYILKRCTYLIIMDCRGYCMVYLYIVRLYNLKCTFDFYK